MHLNGALVPTEDAKVSIFDAGFGMGDGVWEGLRLHKGALLFLDAHLDRLSAGAAAIRIDIGLTREEMVAALRELCEANGMTDGGHLRLMVTRGRKASINQDPRNALGKATIAITAEFKQSVPGPGLVLRSVPTRTTGPEMFDMRLNSHSRLGLIRALLKAIDLGGDEALMLDPQGNIASCNATNFFWVKQGTVFTAGDTYCFNGITRGNVIAMGGVVQGDFPLGHVAEADEAFVTGTMGGVTSVREIDGRALAAGPVTAKIAAAYAAMKDADAEANPLW
ncbi:MAG: aminotransferase class IV [Sphingomonas sp.]